MTLVGGGLSSRATDEAESVKGSDSNDFNSEGGKSFVKRINETTSFHDNKISIYKNYMRKHQLIFCYYRQTEFAILC